MSLRERLRHLATANGCEVILPWFPEARREGPAGRLLRDSRRPPSGPRLLTTLAAFPLWMVLSTEAAVRMLRQHGWGVARRTGVSRWQQFLQMLSLAWGRNVSPLDYYQFRYFQEPYRTKAASFVPAVRLGRLERNLNQGLDTDLLDHKLRAFRAFREADLPTPEIVEIFHPDGKRELGRSDDELAAFEGRDLFVKPINSFGGAGVGRWVYDSESRTYRNRAEVVPGSAIWKHFSCEAAERGFDRPDREARLVQPLMRNHPGLAGFSRAALNTLRVNTLRSRAGKVTVFASSLRMGLGESVEDTSSGLVSNIDLATGRMGPGAALRLAEQTFAQHPDTGATLAGALIPEWEAVLALARRAHERFLQFPFVGWDIAVTPDGPVLIEANTNPRVDVMQAERCWPLAETPFAAFYVEWVEGR